MIERPWTVQAEYPRSEVRDEFKAEDVALDWFPEKGDRYYALMQLFTAMDSTTPGRIVEHLMIARDHVDVELRKLLKDDQTENNQA